MRILRLVPKNAFGLIIACVLVLSFFLSPFSTLLPKVNASFGVWWNTSWTYRKGITFSSSKVGATFASFPVLVDVNDSDLASKARSDGGDIVFTDSNGVKLNHEIEFYDGTIGHLTAWVNVPQLSPSTTLYMYYGNPSASNQQNPTAVWDSNYVMVQHLEENSGSRKDSTVNANNGAPYGGITRINGKVDGADKFDGITGYLTVPHSSSLEATNGLTLEAWIYRNATNDFHTIIGTGWANPWLFRVEGDTRALMLRLRFADNTRTPELEAANIAGNNWYHTVATFDSGKGEIDLYVNGLLAGRWQDGTYKQSLMVSSLQPVFIGCTSPGQNYFNGTLDEVRISNIARPAEWVRTSYYNQMDPSTFYIIGLQEQYGSQTSPAILNEQPKNGAVGSYTNPSLSAQVIDYGGNLMNITFTTNATGSWQNIVSLTNVPSGTYSCIPVNMGALNKTYFWSITATDGGSPTSSVFNLTTTSTVLTPKWVRSGLAYGEVGVVIGDINNDGLEEIIEAGTGSVSALRGTDGGVIWTYSDSAIGWWCQPQMADLNHDGRLEVIVPLMNNPGILVLYGDGTPYWRTTGLGGSSLTSSPVIADIDGNGHPTIFAATEDIEHGLNGSGRLTALSYDGRILRQVFTWRPCSGGLSIADTDNDGEYEIYMGDRSMYMGDGDYGRGVASFWARNLTLRWNRPDFLSSSNIPIPVDVNNDGKMEIVASNIGFPPDGGGFAILNATDGSTIRESLNIGMPVHKKPIVYDIDGDGHLEILTADYEFGNTYDIVIWDLVNWKEDQRLNVGQCVYPPQVADVTGDGIMDIIASNLTDIFVFSTPRAGGGYSLVANATNIPQTEKLGYVVVQDIDGDGYNEVVIQGQSGTVYAYDTPARRPNPRPRSEVQYYSERRLGVAEYVPPPGSMAPIVAVPAPIDGASDVPPSLPQLNFSLVNYQPGLMNYSIQTFPNVGADYQINKPNGRYSLILNRLQYSNTYSWTVCVTNGIQWTNVTYTFTTSTLQSWWNTQWQYRKTITPNPAKIADSLYGFPVLVDVNDSDLASKARSDGGDIVFTDSNGVKLNHEIEFYDGTIGHLTAWVNVPQLSPSTTLYMYYGNPSASNQQNPTAVWDSNYVMVQHLEENSGSRNDSTINGNNGSPFGGITRINGKVDGADKFDGTNGRIVIPDSSSLDLADKLTFEAWIYPVNWGQGSYGRIIDKDYTQAYVFYIRDTTDLTVGFGGLIYGSAKNALTLNSWQYVVATFDRSLTSNQIKFFVNGVLSGSANRTTPIPASSTSLLIGNNAVLTRTFNGTIDEVRISNIARTASWILTSYNNQINPSTFLSMGVEQKLLAPNAPVISNPSPQDRADQIPLSLTQLRFNLTDYQGMPMNYTIVTLPYIGSDAQNNVGNGQYTLNLVGLSRSTFYTWTLAVTDDTSWTNRTFTFTTYKGDPPSQLQPLLNSSLGNNTPNESLTCFNQSTSDPENDQVVNVYNWYRNGTSLTNLLMPFDTRNSRLTKDYSGYGNDGTLVGNVTWISSGQIGGGYEFNRGYIRIPGTTILDGGGQWNELTVELWVYLTSDQNGTRILSKIPSYEIGLGLNGLSNNTLSAGIWTGNGTYYNVVWYPALAKQQWYHIALTYKAGENLTLHVNGQAQTSGWGANVNGTIQTSGYEPIYLGWFDYFRGRIDDVRIYPERLSSQQINQRYLETKDGKTNNSTIVSQETEVGDTWTCQVTPSDSYVDGSAYFSNSITIVSPPPIAGNLTIAPSTPHKTDNLVGNYTYYDPNGDPENGTEIRWYVTPQNGTLSLQPSFNDTLIIPSNATAVGDVWYFTVIPSDGIEYGYLQTSPSVTIQP